MSDEPRHTPEELRFVFDRERHARERWWREDELVNQRTTWLLTTQAVLGTAYGFVRYRIAEIAHRNPDKIPYDYDADRYLETLGLFAGCLVAIGMVGSIVSFFGIWAAHRAQKALQAHYTEFNLGVSPSTTRMGHWTARSTPLLFIIAWGFAFIIFRWAYTVSPAAVQTPVHDARPAVQAQPAKFSPACRPPG